MFFHRQGNLRYVPCRDTSWTLEGGVLRLFHFSHGKLARFF
jgi:hypothetical protein